MTPQRFRLFMFGDSSTVYLSQLQADPNVVLIQDPSAIWGGADMLASGATETQRYQNAAQKNVPWLRRNRATHTESFNSDGWLYLNVGVSSYVGQLPSGVIAAATVTGGGSVASHRVSFHGTNNPTTYVAGVLHRYRFIAKAGTCNVIQLSTHSIAFATNDYANFNLADGTVGDKAATTTAAMSPLGDGWYECIVECTTTNNTGAGQGNFYLLQQDSANSAKDAASAASKTLHITGAMLSFGVCDYQRIESTWPATYTALAQAAGAQIGSYADRAGTTAVDYSDVVVGAMLNGKLAVNTGVTTGLLTGTNWSVSGGVATHTPGVAGSLQYPALEIGSTYQINCTISGRSNGNIRLRAGESATSPAVTVNGAATAIATCVTDSYLRFTPSSDFDGSVSNVSVLKLVSPAIAPSDAARPLLKKDANGKWYLLRDGVDDNLPITFPSLGSNCVTYVCDGTQVVKTTGVTLNGTHNTTTPTNDYGRIYCAAPPTAAREAQIIKYLKAKAGIA